MPTARASIDLTAALAPDPPKVTRYTTTPRIRIAYNRNVFPTSYERNPAFDGGNVEPDAKGNYAWIRDGEIAAYCGKLGMEPQMMVTRGPENESTAWWAGPGQYQPGFQPDANRWDRDDRLGGNNSDPLTEDAANAIGWLSQHADTFVVGGTCPKALPLVMYIEGTTAYNDSGLDKLTLIRNWTARYRLYRKAMGPDAELYSYMTPGFLWGVDSPSADLVAADRAAMYLLSGLHLDGYRRPAHAAYPAKWRGDIDREIAICKARYPELAGNVWVTISPFLDAGTEPMELTQFKSDTEWLVKRHGVHLFVWSSVAQRLADVKKSLDWLGKYN
jgi:hypothetical protein